MKPLRRYLPILDWGARYSGKTFTSDLVAAVIVTIMLIPQSLAYALLVGLPPQVGLYASMAPLVLYAIFGTSRALAVGPVAVASLMTAAAAGQVAAQGTPEFLGAAIALSMVSGLLLIVMGMLRLGFLANFLSHPVVSGFITAAAVQIAAGQLGALLGVKTHGESLLEILALAAAQARRGQRHTAAIGVAAAVFLLWARRGLKPLLLASAWASGSPTSCRRWPRRWSSSPPPLAVWGFGLDARGVAILGKLPEGLPTIALPPVDVALWTKLLVPSLLICIVGYVESISVALTLAAKRRQRVDPDQELIALGAANLGSAVSGGFPVTGGAVALGRELRRGRADAGGRRVHGRRRRHRDAVPDAAAVLPAEGGAGRDHHRRGAVAGGPRRAQAHLGVLAHRLRGDGRDDRGHLVDGVEAGLLAGVALSIFLHLYKTSRPHVAVVGQIPGTTTFRNVERHEVVTDPGDPVAARRREPVLPERALHRGTGQRCRWRPIRRSATSSSSARR